MWNIVGILMIKLVNLYIHIYIKQHALQNQSAIDDAILQHWLQWHNLPNYNTHVIETQNEILGEAFPFLHSYTTALYFHNYNYYNNNKKETCWLIWL